MILVFLISITALLFFGFVKLVFWILNNSFPGPGYKKGKRT